MTSPQRADAIPRARVEGPGDYSALEATTSLGLFVQAVDEYAIFALDPNGAVRTWNVGAQRITGHAEPEVLGRHFSVLHPAADRRSNLPAQALAHAVEHGHWDGQDWQVRKDGTRFWANVVITAVFDPHGLLRGFVEVIRDETERKAAEETHRQLALLCARQRLAVELTETTARGVFSATLALGGTIAMSRDPLVESRILDAIAILDCTIAQIRSLATGSPPEGETGPPDQPTVTPPRS